MKGYRFYEELEHKGKKNETMKGTVLAVAQGDALWWGYPDLPCTSAVFPYPNSEVASDMVSFEYLRDKTRRISEVRAREIHPKLFEYLDQNN